MMITALTPALPVLAFSPSLPASTTSLTQTARFPGSAGKRVKRGGSHAKTGEAKSTHELSAGRRTSAVSATQTVPPALGASHQPARADSGSAGSSLGCAADPTVAPAAERGEPVSGIRGLSPGQLGQRPAPSSLTQGFSPARWGRFSRAL